LLLQLLLQRLLLSLQPWRRHLALLLLQLRLRRRLLLLLLLQLLRDWRARRRG
jgi:hypothetical protein